MEIDNLKTLKNLTPKQEQLADSITKSILELKKQGVHTIIVDGGGGSGLQFVRCSKSDLNDLGTILLEGSKDDIQVANEFIYGPDGYWKYAVDYLVP